MIWGALLLLFGLGSFYASMWFFNKYQTYKDKFQFSEWEKDKVKAMMMENGYTTRHYLTFLEKARADNSIYKGICQIKKECNCVGTSGILFHNGGIVPTQITMMYEKTDGNKLKGLFQNLQTTEMFESISTVLSAEVVNINTSQMFDQFTKIMYENGYGGIVVVLVAIKSSPIMAICLHFKEHEELTIAQAAKINKVIEEIRPHIEKLYHKNYFVNNIKISGNE